MHAKTRRSSDRKIVIGITTDEHVIVGNQTIDGFIINNAHNATKQVTERSKNEVGIIKEKVTA